MTVYAIIKTVLSAVALLLMIAVMPLMIMGAVKKKKAFVFGGIGCLLLSFLCLILSFIVAVKQYYPGMDSFASFTVESSDLKGGYWKTQISHDKGEDLSPQLQWESVSGAAGYAVYMIDPDGNNWLHMITFTEETSLRSGAVKDYIGPYPPSGVHTYEVYVIALREKKNLPGTLNTVSDGFSEILSMLNTYSNSDTGNVIAYGMISGEYPE